MFYSMKKVLLSVLLIGCLDQVVYGYDYTVSKVDFPSLKLVGAEKKRQYYLDLKRKGAIAASGLLTITALYLSWQAFSHYKELDRQGEQIKLLQAKAVADGQSVVKSHQAGAAQPEPSKGFSLLGSLWWTTGKAKQIMSSCSKCLAEGAPGFIAPAVLGKMWQIGSTHISQAAQKGSVQYYIQNETKIGAILQSLELYTIEYDLHASLLSVDTFNQDAKLHMRAFVQDMSRLAKERNEDEFLGEEYFNYLFDEAKKKYVKKSSELERLQEFVVPVQSKLRRVDQDGVEAGQLFKTDEIHRRDIAGLCNLLALEVEKVAIFILAHFNSGQPESQVFHIGYVQKVTDLIDLCNSYLDRMQSLLNKDLDELDVLSKQNQGMFTSTYEFEKVLKEQCEHVHRYCAMVA